MDKVVVKVESASDEDNAAGSVEWSRPVKTDIEFESTVLQPMDIQYAGGVRPYACKLEPVDITPIKQIKLERTASPGKEERPHAVKLPHTPRVYSKHPTTTAALCYVPVGGEQIKLELTASPEKEERPHAVKLPQTPRVYQKHPTATAAPCYVPVGGEQIKLELTASPGKEELPHAVKLPQTPRVYQKHPTATATPCYVPVVGEQIKLERTASPEKEERPHAVKLPQTPRVYQKHPTATAAPCYVPVGGEQIKPERKASPGKEELPHAAQLPRTARAYPKHPKATASPCYEPVGGEDMAAGNRVTVTGSTKRKLRGDRAPVNDAPAASSRELADERLVHSIGVGEQQRLMPASSMGRGETVRGALGESVRVSSPVAGPSSEPVVRVEPPAKVYGTLGETHAPEQSVVSFLANASAIVPENPGYGSELDSENGDDDDETREMFIPAIGYGELAEELVEEANIALAETDRIMNEVHEALPGVNIDFEWSKDYSTFRGTRETFTASSSEFTAFYDTPYDAFIAIWDESIMKHIATETNRYAQQTIDGLVEGDVLTSSTRLNEWAETNENELYVLFGLYIMMGYNPRLRLVDYWSTNHFLNMPGFRETMSYNRHLLLNKFLHFINNEDPVSHNDTKLSKLQPVIDHCCSKFESLYELGEHISIDESLTLCKGRLSWAHCITTKAARFGIKSFELCDSRTGYLWRFMIYTGKSSAQPYHVPIKELARKSTEIVLMLLKGLEGKGYYLTMDSYYNSPLLARYLKSRGFDCVGPLRPNRKNVPDAIKIQQSTAAGTIVARHSGDVSVLSWKDSKVMTIISTFHEAQTYLGRKAGKMLTKPVVARDYNKYMGGVDLRDQKLAMYLVERKRCVKWYMKIFKRLLNVSVHNAYVLHCHTLERKNKTIMNHRDFRQALAEALVIRHNTSISKISQARHAAKRLEQNLGHFPSRSTRRRCARCSALGIMKRVQTACTACDVGLCLGVCWKDYHTLPDLKRKEVPITI